jgi:hypothetical protein
MRLLLAWVAAALLAGCASPPAAPPSTGKNFMEGFDGSEEMPSGWDMHGGIWRLLDEPKAPSQPHVLQQMGRESGTFPHIVATSRGTFGDAEVSLKIRPVSGAKAWGGGLAFRYVDTGNYYVARVDGVEQKVELLEYDNGDRPTHEETYERNFTQGEWVTLKVTSKGDEMKVEVDGTAAFTVLDVTLRVGHVGLWVQDDSVTQFDDLTVRKL